MCLNTLSSNHLTAVVWYRCFFVFQNEKKSLCDFLTSFPELFLLLPATVDQRRGHLDLVARRELMLVPVAAVHHVPAPDGRVEATVGEQEVDRPHVQGGRDDVVVRRRLRSHRLGELPELLLERVVELRPGLDGHLHLLQADLGLEDERGVLGAEEIALVAHDRAHRLAPIGADVEAETHAPGRELASGLLQGGEVLVAHHLEGGGEGDLLLQIEIEHKRSSREGPLWVPGLYGCVKSNEPKYHILGILSR